jgi:predicted O-methyltransferase YrrM
LTDLKSAAAAARSISMLREDALLLLAQLSEQCRGPVIELGPYVGGSTCALAAPKDARVITVELGGANPNHPELPTDDTIADLLSNLSRAGFRERVQIVADHFARVSAYDAVSRHLDGRKAGMLFVDVNPGTELAVQTYASLLREDAFIVIDDYASEYAVEKAAQVRAFVDTSVEQGYLKQICVCGWGTWFGQLTGKKAISGLKDLPASLPVTHAGDYAWHAFVGHDELADDASGNTSPLELFEDDRLLGPAHVMHDTIRANGFGGFSHWRGALYFSTSDNTSPQTNGRHYSIRINEKEWDLRKSSLFP